MGRRDLSSVCASGYSRLVGHFVEESSDMLGNWVAQSVSWAFCGGVERYVGELGDSVG